ncbi:MAG: sensor histidine kinase [Vulcanimicrobiaceae bacterium]
MVPRAELAEALVGNLPSEAVPLLVVRLPDLERLAWREGRRAARALERRSTKAFVDAARRTLRADDVIAHEPGDEDFLAALRSPARAGASVAVPTDSRATLARLASALEAATGLRVETGWTVVRASAGEVRLAAVVEEALERGAHERERYAFFSTIGHELRTPLTSIRGYLETILDEQLDPHRQRAFLETVYAEATRLSRLVDGLFEISLLDLRATAHAAANCQSDDALRRAVAVVEPIAARRGVRIDNRGGSSARALMDCDHLIQVIVNLLENAVKHGAERGHIEVSSTTLSPRFLEICIDDDGPGIPPAERQRIFELSTRGSRASSTGSGLGLAVARLMIERVNGEIDVVDSPLGGSRFRARLPLIPPMDQAGCTGVT